MSGALLRGLYVALLLWGHLASAAPVTLTDASGATVRLAAPAQRIVALAPHLVENLYTIGAGSRLVGAVDYADYPPEAAALPRVGGYSRIDVEAVVARRPDLVVGWLSGNSPAHIDRLRALGIPVFLSQPDRFEDVASELEQLGRLTGRNQSAQAAASAFRTRLAHLRATHAGKPVVRVFYQVWATPLATVGGRQIISSAIATCGGENVFADLLPLAPQVSIEAVLAKNAEVFVAGGMGDGTRDPRRDWLDQWRRWPQLTAVQRDNLFVVPADLLQRHTVRLLDGAEQLCAHLETARRRRPGGR